MDVEKCIEGRRSIRSFKSKELTDQEIEEALRMANLAPSAGNLQARDFIVVKDEGTRNALSAAALSQNSLSEAPVVIVFCANLKRIGHYGERGRTLYCLQDTAAAVENMLLYLHGRGFGGVWIGAFDESKVRKILHIPDEARPVALVPIGYPAEEGTKTQRMNLDRIAHKEKW